MHLPVMEGGAWVTSLTAIASSSTLPFIPSFLIECKSISNLRSTSISTRDYLLSRYNIGEMAAASAMAPQWPLKEANQPPYNKQGFMLTAVDDMSFSHSTHHPTGAYRMGSMACGILILLRYGI